METIALREGNLGEGPQNLRMRVGVIAFGVGLVGAVAMIKLGAPPVLRLLLGLPFFVGASTLYMGLFHTCSGLAAQGMRDSGDGPVPIVDPAELRAVKKSAMIVMALGAVSAAAATAGFVLLG